MNIAIVGATGNVGRKILEVLEKKKIPIKNLFLLASKKSSGKELFFNGKNIKVENLENFDFSKADITFFSAGGNIAAALAQTCISSSLQRPNKLVLLSPWLDLSVQSKSNDKNYSEFSPFDKEDTISFSEDYIGKIDRNDSRVSPIYGSFEDFPETHIQASKVEFLFDDTVECIQKLNDANVEHSVHFEEKALHGWHLVPDFLPEASRSMMKVVEFLKR